MKQLKVKNPKLQRFLDRINGRGEAALVVIFVIAALLAWWLSTLPL